MAASGTIDSAIAKVLGAIAYMSDPGRRARIAPVRGPLTVDRG
jgi:hypothetical protein